MTSAQKFLDLKKAVEEANREAERSRGALEQLRGRLRDEFAVNDEDEGRALLEYLEAQEAELQERLDGLFESIRTKYPDFYE